MADKIALPRVRSEYWQNIKKSIKMLSSPTIRWRTAFTYALIIVCLMSTLGIALATQAYRWHTATTQSLLHDLVIRVASDSQLTENITQAVTIAPATLATADEQQALTALLEERSVLLGARLSLYAADGQPLADSHLKSTALRRADSLREMESAAGNSATPAMIFDPLLGTDMYRFTHPIEIDREPVAFLRVSFPIQSVDSGWGMLRRWVISTTTLCALIIIAMMVFQAERAAYTLRRLTTAAEKITKGDLSARTLSLSGGEVGQFVRAFNRMADKLQQQMQKRAREKDRLHTVLHVMTDGVLLLNRHNSVRLLNDAAARILETTPERALRRSFVQTVRDHRIVDVFRRCQSSGQTETAVIERTEDSVIRMVVTPFLRGKDRGHLVVLQDLTRMHQLQTARQDFVSNISHELRTPLASLRALVETLSDGALEDPDAAQRFLRHMEVEVDALTQMVQELLELSRIESGKVQLQLAPVDTAHFITQSCERLQAQATRADVALMTDLIDELPLIKIDITRMQQVITNLIHNAIKFTPVGGTITVSAVPSADNTVTVSIADTGVGIAYEDLPRIFERFYKADRARTGGGTGLGLAIAKHIVQIHGGRIWAESIPGQGSTFSFTVPTVTSVVENSKR